jgi:hypothetical protein
VYTRSHTALIRRITVNGDGGGNARPARAPAPCKSAERRRPRCLGLGVSTACAEPAKGRRKLAARVIYGEIAPILEALGYSAAIQGEDADLAPLLNDLYSDLIEKMRHEPKGLLERERLIRQRWPILIDEVTKLDLPPILPDELRREAPKAPDKGPAAPGDISGRAELKLTLAKTTILQARATDRNWSLLKGVFATLGLDFLIDIGRDIFDDEYRKGAEDFIALLVAGLFVKAVEKIIAWIWRLVKLVLTKAGLWEKLVEKYGRLKLLRFLGGLAGRLSPVILGALIAYGWYQVWREWQEKDKVYQEQLKQLYRQYSGTNRDTIFMKNLGYLPN